MAVTEKNGESRFFVSYRRSCLENGLHTTIVFAIKITALASKPVSSATK
ncbi:hypothetical protein FLA_3532 [Filimonas lacunae]|nr:hypothetical protein FLA_3532 [Filimonas lacunae]